MSEQAIDPSVPPSGDGCVECLAADGWWIHLRRCATCGQVGCCNSSPGQHATAHFQQTGHPMVQSFEPGEDWFWDYRTEDYVEGPTLAEPTARPADHPVPGPAGAVPDDWRSKIHR
ncbi:UBP-type zinc finger domain-containing protein [Ornithinimicrobium cryptoxanthini]|uniref:UBP-type zinc finger domain-containing protein n=1 Tax=Ornithinimicrobium cryptoxanthini TaxID=2934161 RepID=A0ABY4YIJ3_9MICO|nr:UBP-type zinc finger domain-containing protein [Ornithinimicrobium cryptoxanthini]USQ76429.1 UBP-type zinc finger domain-containing protein [Ornithinimicrobium cryptoxanthini]